MKEVVLTVLYIPDKLILLCNVHVSLLKIISLSFLGHPLPLLPSLSASYTLVTSLSGSILAKASLCLNWLLIFSIVPLLALTPL